MEIQSPDLESIAEFAARAFAKEERRPVVVEDSGLFIKALKGFPGPYSSYVHTTLGIRAVLRLTEDVRSRDAYFQSVVATCIGDGHCRTFSGKVYGSISHCAVGKRGFGFDPIFVPKGESRTFAEMPQTVKNRYSHRAGAFQKFAKWYLSL